MTITYRTDGDWGSGKGANLTAAEVDGNVYDHETRITSLENDPPEAISISNVTQAGGVATFHLSDGSTFTVDLPTATIKFRGDYTASAAYNVNDLVNAPGYGLYLVLIAHTAPAAFDPDASDTDGDYYQQVTPATYEPKTVITTTYTPILSDTGKYLRCTNASSCAVTLPDDDTVAFASGAEITFRQADDGVISFVEGSTDVTINGMDGFLNETAGTGSVVTAKKAASNTWDLIGRLAEDVTA